MRRMHSVWMVGAMMLVFAAPGTSQEAEQLARELRALQGRQLDVAAAMAQLRAREIMVAARHEARLPFAGRSLLPVPYLPQDPADSLYRAAREQMNARRYEEAARKFAELRERYPRSGYVGDAFYFQALALYRSGSTTRLQQAQELLTQLETRYPDASTAAEARALAVRIQSSLASQGDAEAAAAVTRQATAQCDDEDQSVRATALSALLGMDPDQAIPILREVLRQRDECTVELRKQAVFMLSRNQSDETFDLLVDLAIDSPDPDPEIRNAAIFWLARSDRPEALDALLRALDQPDLDPDAQEQVVSAIGRHDSPRALEVLRDYARNASAPTEIRANAIFWLGQRGGADAMPFLRELWGSLDDAELKDRVLFAVARSGGTESLTWLLDRARDANESLQVRKQALFWAGRAGLSVEQALDIYRSSPDREMKEQVLFVLSRDREDRTAAVDAMMEIARDEEDRELRSRAIFWLGQSEDPRVAEFLLDIIRGG